MLFYIVDVAGQGGHSYEVKKKTRLKMNNDILRVREEFMKGLLCYYNLENSSATQALVISGDKKYKKMFKVCFNKNLTSARNHCFKSPLVQRIKPVYKSINTDILVQSIRAPEVTCKAFVLYGNIRVYALCQTLTNGFIS